MYKIKIFFFILFTIIFNDVYCQTVSASELLYLIKIDKAKNTMAINKFFVDKGFEFMKNPDPNITLYICTKCRDSQTIIGFMNEIADGKLKRYYNFNTSDEQVYIKLKSEFLAINFKQSSTTDDTELLKSPEKYVVINKEQLLGRTSYSFIIGEF
jgi:hypothetical protein